MTQEETEPAPSGDPSALESTGSPAEPAREPEPTTPGDATEPQTHTPPAPAHTGGGNAALIPILGLMLLVLSALAVGLVVFLTGDDDDIDYGATRADDAYDLPAMALQAGDVPEGMDQNQTVEYTNEEWAELLSPDDPDLKKNQLDSQQRIRNHVSFYIWENPTEHLGRTISITSQSTLYETEDAAKADIGRLCGLFLDDKDPLTEFTVPKLGDQSVGFFITSTDPQLGKIVETVTCFRTGRVVHGVIQNGLDGTQSRESSIQLARRMLTKVDEAFGTKKDKKDDEDPQEG